MAAPRPPAGDPLVALADRCVQCGLCLPACPTYAMGRMEPESPRGRIALVRAWASATAAPTPAGDTHLDNCLACRNCEVACPAGVDYGSLLVQARSRQRARRGARARQRAVEWLAAHPAWLARALGLYRRLYHHLPAPLRPLPRPADGASHTAAMAVNPDGAPDRDGDHRPAVAVFMGCAARAYEPAARAALATLLERTGFAMHLPAGQTCCGSLHAHGGAGVAARRLQAANGAAFRDAPTVLTLASGCHEAVAAALPAAAKAVDALDFLAAHVDRLRFATSPQRVALHLPCTQRNVVLSVPALRRLLDAVPGLDVVELRAGFGCCGAAGTRMLTDPTGAATYRQPLLDQLHDSGARVLLSANLGCRLHLGNGTGVEVLHPVEFLARCLAPR